MNPPFAHKWVWFGCVPRKIDEKDVPPPCEICVFISDYVYWVSEASPPPLIRSMGIET